MLSVRAGLQKDYLQGLDHLRQQLRGFEHELAQTKREFYCCQENNETLYEEYLVLCNDRMLQCNNQLRKMNLPLSVLDSEVRLLGLLNDVRLAEVDSDVISFLTEFWENIKMCTEGLRTLGNKVQVSVLNRLKSSCQTYTETESDIELSVKYSKEIKTYLNDVETTMGNYQLLVRSYENKIRQDLYTNTNFSERVLITCDPKAFPILRLVPDLTEKMDYVFRIARRWIDRDETYVYEINTHIRETRNARRKRRDDLKTEQDKHKRASKNIKAAHILFQNNKIKLSKIVTELNQLEKQITQFNQVMSAKNEEKNNKQSMMAFLKISISQTKKANNYTLQLQKARIVRQLREIENQLIEIKRNLDFVLKDCAVKTQEKEIIAEKVEHSGKVCTSLSTELQTFSENIQKLQEEVNELSGNLSQLEMIHDVKTSPENVDYLYDRPSTVKLAPSLREKIKRKRKLVSQSI